MTRQRRPQVGKLGGFALFYTGTDPHYHRPHPENQNRPACEPAREPGVLTTMMRAKDTGLIVCSECWPDETN